jgi:hypothetical protein
VTQESLRVFFETYDAREFFGKFSSSSPTDQELDAVLGKTPAPKDAQQMGLVKMRRFLWEKGETEKTKALQAQLVQVYGEGVYADGDQETDDVTKDASENIQISPESGDDLQAQLNSAQQEIQTLKDSLLKSKDVVKATKKENHSLKQKVRSLTKQLYHEMHSSMNLALERNREHGYLKASTKGYKVDRLAAFQGWLVHAFDVFSNVFFYYSEVLSPTFQAAAPARWVTPLAFILMIANILFMVYSTVFKNCVKVAGASHGAGAPRDKAKIFVKSRQVEEKAFELGVAKIEKRHALIRVIGEDAPDITLGVIVAFTKGSWSKVTAANIAFSLLSSLLFIFSITRSGSLKVQQNQRVAEEKKTVESAEQAAQEKHQAVTEHATREDPDSFGTAGSKQQKKVLAYLWSFSCARKTLVHELGRMPLYVYALISMREEEVLYSKEVRLFGGCCIYAGTNPGSHTPLPRHLQQVAGGNSENKGKDDENKDKENAGNGEEGEVARKEGVEKEGVQTEKFETNPLSSGVNKHASVNSTMGTVQAQQADLKSRAAAELANRRQPKMKSMI